MAVATDGATRPVDGLVDAGLIGPAADPAERRVQLAVLTETGRRRKVQEAADSHLDDLDTEVFSLGEVAIVQAGADDRCTTALL